LNTQEQTPHPTTPTSTCMKEDVSLKIQGLLNTQDYVLEVPSVTFTLLVHNPKHTHSSLEPEEGNVLFSGNYTFLTKMRK